MNFSFWFVENADQKRFGAKQKFFHLINGLIKSRYSQNVRGKLFRRFFSGDGEFRVVFGRLIKIHHIMLTPGWRHRNTQYANVDSHPEVIDHSSCGTSGVDGRGRICKCRTFITTPPPRAEWIASHNSVRLLTATDGIPCATCHRNSLTIQNFSYNPMIKEARGDRKT